MRRSRGGIVQSFLRGPPGTDCGATDCSHLQACPMCEPLSSSAQGWSACNAAGEPCARFLLDNCHRDTPRPASRVLIYLLPGIVLLMGWGWACCLYPVYSYMHRSSPVGPEGEYQHFVRFMPEDIQTFRILVLDSTQTPSTPAPVRAAPLLSPSRSDSSLLSDSSDDSSRRRFSVIPPPRHSDACHIIHPWESDDAAMIAILRHPTRTSTTLAGLSLGVAKPTLAAASDHRHALRPSSSLSSASFDK